MAKLRIIIYSLVGIACFVLGRNTAPKQVVAQVKEKEVIVKQVVTITKKPDGTTVTVIATDKKTDIKKEVASTPAPRINISALAGVDATQRLQPVYGVEVSKQLLGPVRIGAWGMTNGTIGISAGFDF